MDAAGYCAEHRRDARAHRVATKPNPTTPLARALDQLRGNSSAPRVPDDARYTIPGWLKISSTEKVVHHLLRDTDASVRWLCAFTLRKRRDLQTIEPLWQALQTDVVALVRQQSAVALGKIGARAVTSPLIEALWHDRDPGVRQACAIALGNLGDPVAAHDLARALECEPVTFVRWDCVLALERLGDTRVEALLVQIAKEDRAEVVRRACGDALMEIRQRG